jgi:hypothetical protein
MAVNGLLVAYLQRFWAILGQLSVLRRQLGASVTQVWLNSLSFCLQESGKTPNGDLIY